MTDSNLPRPDTSDMAAVHKVFRSSLESAPAFVASAEGSDGRRELIANYYENVLAFLHVHHDGEEELVFSLLTERAPDHRATVEHAAAQHREALARLEVSQKAVAGWRAGGDGEAAAVVGALGGLEEVLIPHLDQEEAEILPLAAEYLNAQEWGMLPAHGFGHFQGDKVWLILGLIRENMSTEQKAQMLAHMPPPAREMWETQGESAFLELIGEVRTPG